jgi:hypothetical protein
MFDIRTDRRGRRWSRLVAAPLGVVALVTLAACGTSTGTSAASTASAPTSASTGTASTQAAGDLTDEMAAFRSCLEENGVTLPERPSGGGGTPPQGGSGDTPPQGGTPPSGAPAAAGGGNGQGTPGQAPPGVDAATWATAQEACADLAPTPPGGGAAPSASSDS